MKKALFNIIATAGLFIIYSGVLFSQSTIRGSVKSGPTGEPVPDAQISIGGVARGSTDTEGNYAIGVATGTNTLAATYNGTTISKSITFAPDDNWMNFWFDPPSLPSDFDGNYYNTVNIGTQTWMVENLKVTHFRDRSNIQYVPDNPYWGNLTSSGYCWYNGNYAAYKDIFGPLYNWYAVNAGNLCPAGWHVPTHDDLIYLRDFLGGVGESPTVGGELKEAGTSHWNEPNTGASNSTGFTALPGGTRGISDFSGIGQIGSWWTSSVFDMSSSWDMELRYDVNVLYIDESNIITGRSVRCLNDSELPELAALTTAVVTNISNNSAQSGGNINSDGGSPITERGVCWSIEPNPYITDNHTSDGTGTGSYISLMTGLASNTTYYARAFATNSMGTVYGNEISFTTSPDLPSVNTLYISNITPLSSHCVGEVTSDGGAALISKGVCWNTTGNPTISDNASQTGGGPDIGTFECFINKLLPSTQYYVRAFATNIAGPSYGEAITFTTDASFDPIQFSLDPEEYGIVTDIDLNEYRTIQIGTQVWMAENLKTTKYNTGIGIPNIIIDSDWEKEDGTEGHNGAYCWYGNAEDITKDVFGALYNWYAVNTGNLCPTGWHVPSDEEWTTLVTYLGGTNEAGGKLKEIGTFHWAEQSEGTTNVTGFTALPGGFRMTGGVDYGIGDYGHWWSSTPEEGFPTRAWDWNMSYGWSGFGRSNNLKRNGSSVRCIKDEYDPFVVTNTDDSGPGSLRNAIEAANTTTGVKETITFNIPGEGIHTIQPLISLPEILDPVIIDGYTQPGASPANETTPAIILIELDGSNLADPSVGLNITQGHSTTIRGLMINGFNLNAIQIFGQGGNIIEGNHIGMDVLGNAKGNNWAAIKINESPGNIIGGDSPENRNVISIGEEGGDCLIFIDFPLSTNNVVKGNFLGLGPDGNTKQGESEVGIRINAGAHHNTIGPNNVISGNALAGIQMEPSPTDNSNNNLIIGNLIGTNHDGTVSIPNGNGIRIFGATNNKIGGDNPEERNIISGNVNIGIEINPSELFPGSGNVVTGNYIGTNASGTLPLLNGGSGIEILNGATENIIGGGNLISGNGFAGVVISGQSIKNQVIDNIIGTNITVDALISNGDDGVHISDASENLVSGNILCGAGRNGVGNNGIEILGALASGNIITGNYIGTNSVSTPGLGNGFMGIQIKRDAHQNIIGPGNVISGNLNHGVLIESDSGWEGATSADNNVIKGNYIGTTTDGEDALGNNMCGIMIQDKASDNIIGPENCISGNIGSAINISGTSTTGNHVMGNYIGTDRSGKNPIPNGHGIAIEDGASKNYIGDSAPGLGNLIAFNSNVGIWLGSNSTYVQSNEIVGHSQDGIFIDGSNNTIGGSDPVSRNFLHGNNNGIRTGANANDNTIEGNYLGTDKAGESDQTEGYNGVALSGSYNLVKNNLISGYNNGHGIYIQRWLNPDGPIPEGNRLEGNIIGMNASETAAIPNQHGISLNTAVGTIIHKNVVAGNQYDGIHISGQFFNEDDDYHYSVNNLISQNSFYNNGQLGIDLDLDFVTGNDENDPDEGPNNLQNFPVIQSISFSPGVVDISGTLNSVSNTEYTIEFFANLVADENDFGGHYFGEGETYLGSETVTTGADGNVSFAVIFPIKSGDGQVITATATDPDGNTSEFSRAVGGYADQEVGTEWPLHYKYNRLGVENITNGSDINAVINSFQTWSDVPTADVEFVNDGPTDDRYASIDGVNLVSFVDDQFPWAPGILAYASKTIQMDADGQTGKIIDADIIVNPDFVNSLTGTLEVTEEEGKEGFYDIQSVITHEIGHLLGLIHTGVVDATMFFWLDDGTTTGRSLEPDDVAWVSYKYPGANFSGTYGTLSGDVTYGYAVPNPKVAGALVTAENTEGTQFHSYSDAEGEFTVPVERNGSYTIHIQPLDGNVYGFPMKPGNISSYIYSNTIYTDYPDEFYSGDMGEQAEKNDGNDRAAELVDLTDGPVSITTNPDLTPPDIVSITPNDGQPVKIMPDIIISFSEPVETTSLSDETCWLESGGTKYYGNFTELGGNSDVILFSPNEPLAYSTTYELHLAEYVDNNTPCITDLKGNGLVSTYPDYSITTVSEDGTSPEITGIIPENEAVGVFVTDKILVFFSEPMNKTSVESGFTLGCTATPDVEGSFSWKNDNTLMTFTPTGSLEEGTVYTITFTGPITDLSNNPMSAVAPSTFTTVMAAAPEIVYMEPGNLIETGVSVTTPVVVDFSEPINPSTVNSTTFKLIEGAVQISGTYEFLNDNSRVVFRPDADLEFNTVYAIILTSGIMDVSPSSLPFDPGADSWFPATFTTAAEPSEPEIYYIDPPSGVSGSLVTIGGKGFDPDPADNSVMFGDIPATIKSATLTSLTVEVPKGALSGMVTVTTGGTTTDPGFYFYVIPQSLDPCENVLSNTKTGSKSRDVDVTGDGALAYVTNSGSNSVSVIDLTTTPGPTLIKDISVNIGVSPLKIDINPAGTKAYVTNFGSHTVSVIDLTDDNGTKNQVIEVINVGINPYGVAVTPNGDRVYVSNYSSNNLSVIDADPNSGGFDHVVANVNTGTRNRDLAVTGDAGLVLVAGDNGLTIVNSDPGDLDYNCVIANSSSGSRTRDVGVSGDAGIAFVTTEEGQLLIIDIYPSSDFFGAVLANVSSGSKARDVKISGDGLHVYVTTENNDVLVYQINPGGAPASPGCYAGNITLTLHATIPGAGNEGLVIDTDNERLFVVNSNTGNEDESEINVIQICCGPITPEKSIGDMIITIQNMISNGKIPRIRGYALIILLNRSLVNIEKDRLKLAIVDLRAFISLVRNYIKFKHISADQGNALIDAANAVIAQLRGTKSGEEEYMPDNSDQLMDISRDVISESRLGSIYPNPFSESITINFEIAENTGGSEKVQVCIYDVSGRLVGTLIDYKMEPGRYSTIWSGRYDSGGAAPLGTYFIRFRTNTKEEVKQIMLVR